MLTITVYSMDQAYELIDKFSVKFEFYEIKTEGMNVVVKMYNK